MMLVIADNCFTRVSVTCVLRDSKVINDFEYADRSHEKRRKKKKYDASKLAPYHIDSFRFKLPPALTFRNDYEGCSCKNFIFTTGKKR